MIGDRHLAPAGQRLTQHEQRTHAPTLALVIDPRRLSRCGRHGHACIGHQLLTRLVQTHQRATRVVGTGIHLQDVLHVPDELATELIRQTPILFQPRLEFVFFSVRRTVIRDSVDMSNSTSLLARRRRVQRLRPSGGGLHATATRCASWAPSSLRRRVVGDGRGRSAASGPSSTHRVRTRSTLERHVQRVHNLVVTPGRTAWPFIGLQENARVHQRASRRLPYTHQLLRVSPLLPKQLDVLNLAHTGLYRNRQDYPSKAS